MFNEVASTFSKIHAPWPASLLRHHAAATGRILCYFGGSAVLRTSMYRLRLLRRFRAHA